MDFDRYIEVFNTGDDDALAGVAQGPDVVGIDPDEVGLDALKGLAIEGLGRHVGHSLDARVEQDASYLLAASQKAHQVAIGADLDGVDHIEGLVVGLPCVQQAAEAPLGLLGDGPQRFVDVAPFGFLGWEKAGIAEVCLFP